MTGTNYSKQALKKRKSNDKNMFINKDIR